MVTASRAGGDISCRSPSTRSGRKQPSPVPARSHMSYRARQRLDPLHSCSERREFRSLCSSKNNSTPRLQLRRHAAWPSTCHRKTRTHPAYRIRRPSPTAPNCPSIASPSPASRANRRNRRHGAFRTAGIDVARYVVVDHGADAAAGLAVETLSANEMLPARDQADLARHRACRGRIAQAEVGQWPGCRRFGEPIIGSTA